jgi:hypothetical protein
MHHFGEFLQIFFSASGAALESCGASAVTQRGADQEAWSGPVR